MSFTAEDILGEFVEAAGMLRRPELADDWHVNISPRPPVTDSDRRWRAMTRPSRAKPAAEHKARAPRSPPAPRPPRQPKPPRPKPSADELRAREAARQRRMYAARRAPCADCGGEREPNQCARCRACASKARRAAQRRRYWASVGRDPAGRKAPMVLMNALVPPDSLARWRRLAELEGVCLSEWVRGALGSAENSAAPSRCSSTSSTSCNQTL